MREDSPYRSPNAPLDEPPLRPSHSVRPNVLGWFTLYCGILTVVYLGLAGLVFLISDSIGESLIIGVVGLVMTIVFGFGLFLPRERWAWIYGIVLIGLGMTSCVTLPFCIAMLIFWIKPEVKDYFDSSRRRFDRFVRD